MTRRRFTSCTAIAPSMAARSAAAAPVPPHRTAKGYSNTSTSTARTMVNRRCSSGCPIARYTEKVTIDAM